MASKILKACLVAGARAATLSGCGSGGTPSRNARITGAFEACGGLLGFHHRRNPCEIQGGAVVSAFNSHHQLVARQPLVHGRFSFLVPAGPITLMIYRYTRAVTAKASTTVHANVTFQMK